MIIFVNTGCAEKRAIKYIENNQISDIFTFLITENLNVGRTKNPNKRISNECSKNLFFGQPVSSIYIISAVV